MWKDIEKSVGELNYDDFSLLYIDESKDDKEYRANWINEDIFSPYIEVLHKISDYFKIWVNQLNTNNAREYLIRSLENSFDSSTKFLCFNYTDTLENVYNICKKNI